MPNRFPPLGGGSSISDISLETLEHIKYNGETNRLEIDVSLETTLNSLWLSDQWRMSSGGNTLFFSSSDQKIDFTPVMKGFRRHDNPSNLNKDGVIRAFTRDYSDSALYISLKGTEDEFGAVPYSGVTNVTSNLAVFGVTATLAENLYVGEKIQYILWSGTDKTGPVIFRQSITVSEDRVSGFKFTGIWSQPAEEYAGNDVYAEIQVTDLKGRYLRTLMVRPTMEDPSEHWNELIVRTFDDTLVLTDSRYKPKHITSSVNLDDNGRYSVNTTSGSVTITIDNSSNVEHIEVMDSVGSFSVLNPCLVVFANNSAGTATLQTSGDHYEFYNQGGTWYYLDKSTGRGGLV